MLEMVMLTMFNASPVYTSLIDFYAKNPRLFQIKRQGRWILDIYLYTSIPLSTFLTTMARLHANKLLFDDPSSKKRSRKAPKKDFPPVCFLWCPEGDDTQTKRHYPCFAVRLLWTLWKDWVHSKCALKRFGVSSTTSATHPQPEKIVFSSDQSEHPRTTGRQA